MIVYNNNRSACATPCNADAMRLMWYETRKREHAEFRRRNGHSCCYHYVGMQLVARVQRTRVLFHTVIVDV